MTQKELEQWIDNDEGLYDWWKGSGMTKKKFIAENREQIEEVIRNVVEGKKPAHYLKYGTRG